MAEDTFRPPWFHRNIASEFMGLVYGEYDAKGAGEDGFVPGASSLHNCMSAHGPDATAFNAGSSTDTRKPQHLTDTMAIMFETRNVLCPTRQAMESPALQQHYDKSWTTLEKHFKSPT